MLWSGTEPWLDELCRAAFLRKQSAYHRWTSLRIPANRFFRESKREANACYANALARYNARYREKLASASSTRNWWNTLKESVMGVGSSIPPLITV